MVEGGNPASLSIVIPTFNEAGTIEQTLAHLKAITQNIEIIVVDGGSQDATEQIAVSFGVTVLTNTDGRAAQLNQGASAAQGKRLLFLHADTFLPDNFAAYVEITLAQPGVIMGAFELQIAGPNPGLRWVEQAVNWRSRWLQLPYGDQALFLERETFWAAGGFPNQPIMEDFILVQQLKQRGMIALAPAAVITSGRRWHKLGVCRTTLFNQAMIIGYYLGVSPERLSRWYRQQR
ncbi:MAG: TIGR04283 family arsenosugar biosynthesis glycosyltransferase [Cyanobacteria bacterium P01_H01_bin.121]